MNTKRESEAVFPLTLMTIYFLIRRTASSPAQLLARELPAIGEKNSMILKGPAFEGITKIEDGMMTLSIETECRQADAYKVKLYVYGELQKLFSKNGIRI